MSTPDDPTVFRRHPVVRYLTPLLCFVPLGFWVAAMGRTGEWWLLPFLLVGSVVTAGVTAVALAKQTVVLDSVGIRWSTPFRSWAVPWDQVVALANVDRFVDITWSAGRALLPIPARSREAIGPAVPPALPAPPYSSGTLLASVTSAWIARGRANWTLPEPEPWVPSIAASGRVVIRPTASAPSLSFLSAFFAAMLGPTMYPSQKLSASLLVSFVVCAVAVSVYVVIRWWSRVEVGEAVVVVRSFPFRVRRFPRSNITGVGVVGPPIPNAARIQHLALHTTSGVVRLPAPVTANSPILGDPNFYRIWHWLDHELCSGARRPPVPVWTVVARQVPPQVQPRDVRPVDGR